MLTSAATLTSLTIAAEHPAYAGHFPGAPVLPGVVMLDAVVHALEHAGNRATQRWHVASAKFFSAVRPGDALTLEREALPNGSVRFAVRTSDRTVAQGLLVPAAIGPAHG